MRPKAKDPWGQATTGSSKQFGNVQGKVLKQEDSEHKDGTQEVDRLDWADADREQADDDKFCDNGQPDPVTGVQAQEQVLAELFQLIFDNFIN